MISVTCISYLLWYVMGRNTPTWTGKAPQALPSGSCLFRNCLGCGVGVGVGGQHLDHRCTQLH